MRLAVDIGGEGTKVVEELVSDFFGLFVRLAEALVIEHGEDLVEELPVHPGERGLLGQTVSANWTVTMQVRGSRRSLSGKRGARHNGG